jgi:hypothetical protein
VTHCPSTTGLDEEFLLTAKNDTLRASSSTNQTFILANGLDKYDLKINLLYFISREKIRILIEHLYKEQVTTGEKQNRQAELRLSHGKEHHPTKAKHPLQFLIDANLVWFS